MPRDGAIIFSDLVGKLDMLAVTCDKCGRKGRYAVARLIERREPLLRNLCKMPLFMRRAKQTNLICETNTMVEDAARDARYLSHTGGERLLLRAC
jgi:hypothetical protein